jgi:hypothetical protein
VASGEQRRPEGFAQYRKFSHLEALRRCIAAAGALLAIEFHMPDIDYLARAELMLGSDRETAKLLGSRVFRLAANALRFAIEEVAPISLRGAQLRIGDRTFSGIELQSLYSSDAYPLPRKGQRRPRRSLNRTTH